MARSPSTSSSSGDETVWVLSRRKKPMPTASAMRKIRALPQQHGQRNSSALQTIAQLTPSDHWRKDHLSKGR
eukprot:1742981-Amphidinium_carterae.1